MTSPLLNAGYANPSARRVGKAVGAELHFTNGETCIDMFVGAGTHILGHGHPAIRDAIHRQVDDALLHLQPFDAAEDYARLLLGILPQFGGVIFCSSGSEATQRAVRLARAHSGKTKVAMFAGGWHGGTDSLLFGENAAGPAENPWMNPRSAGIPTGVCNDTILLPYAHDHAFDIIRQHQADLACVVVEPIQASNPRENVVAFLKDLRTVTRDSEILLCFDEVITGFRLSLGGAQARYGIDADIATYGKIVGGGTPAGMVAARDDLLAAVRRGGVFMGGTFAANPLTIAAGSAMIKELHRSSALYDQIEASAALFQSLVNTFADDNGLACRFHRVGSLGRLTFSRNDVTSKRDREAQEPKQDHLKAFSTRLLQRGLNIPFNSLAFTSLSHGETVIRRAASIVCDTLCETREDLFNR